MKRLPNHHLKPAADDFYEINRPAPRFLRAKRAVKRAVSYCILCMEGSLCYSLVNFMKRKLSNDSEVKITMLQLKMGGSL